MRSIIILIATLCSIGTASAQTLARRSWGRHPILRLLAVLAIVSFGAVAVAHAAEACKASCYGWCIVHNPTSACRAVCATRPTCNTMGATCFSWCEHNKPGDAACREDCRLRDLARRVFEKRHH